MSFPSAQDYREMREAKERLQRGYDNLYTRLQQMEKERDQMRRERDDARSFAEQVLRKPCACCGTPATALGPDLSRVKSVAIDSLPAKEQEFKSDLPARFLLPPWKRPTTGSSQQEPKER